MLTDAIVSSRLVACCWYCSKGSNTPDYYYVQLPLWHDLVIGTECTWSFNSGCVMALHAISNVDSKVKTDTQQVA